jgi:hypothetical protein
MFNRYSDFDALLFGDMPPGGYSLDIRDPAASISRFFFEFGSATNRFFDAFV